MRAALPAVVIAVFASPALAAGFVPAPGATLPLHALPVETAPGTLLPWPQATLLHSAAQPGAYWLTAGMGVPGLGIDDLPMASAWRVEATAECARLVRMPLADAKAPGLRAVQHSELLPMVCAAGFTDDCTSTDGQLRIQTTFAGTQRQRTVRGGFFGSEGPVAQTLSSGTRTLTLTHQPTGRQLQLNERLSGSPAYTAPQTAIRYLPGLRRVLLLGVVQERGAPAGHCVALP